MVMARNEHPIMPPRVWLLGYALQCVLHMVCVLVEYRRRNRVKNNRTPRSHSSRKMLWVRGGIHMRRYIHESEPPKPRKMKNDLPRIKITSLRRRNGRCTASKVRCIFQLKKPSSSTPWVENNDVVVNVYEDDSSEIRLYVNDRNDQTKVSKTCGLACTNTSVFKNDDKDTNAKKLKFLKFMCLMTNGHEHTVKTSCDTFLEASAIQLSYFFVDHDRESCFHECVTYGMRTHHKTRMSESPCIRRFLTNLIRRTYFRQIIPINLKTEDRGGTRTRFRLDSAEKGSKKSDD
ncbi:hypothetical protein YC2023_083947 [Brassica napus]